MNQNTRLLSPMHSCTPRKLSAGLLCLTALSGILSSGLSGCASTFSKGASGSEKTEDRPVREMPAALAGKPSAQESSAFSKPVATAPMSYPARAVPKRIEASTHAPSTKDNGKDPKEKKKEPENDSALNGYRLALIDSIEAANAGMVTGRLAGAPKEKVVLRLRVGQEGKPKITVLKPGQLPELVELAKSAVERSTPLLPSPTPKASVVVITFLFGSDNRFKLQ